MPSAELDDRWSLPVKRLKYGLIFVGLCLLWALLYYSINAATAGRDVAQPLLPHEAELPLVSALYPVYALVYVQVFTPILAAPTRLRFIEIQVAYTLVSLVGFAVFLLAPMPYPRPALEVQSIFDQLLAWGYARDGCRCTFPSLHVAIAWTLFLGLRDVSSRWRAALLLSASGISVAAVLVKQHFIVDIVAGAALAVVGWRAAVPLTRILLQRLQRS
jgi:membrane-associated phospholipid phosphatase